MSFIARYAFTRNSRGSLPVYSDVRHGNGQLNSLANDLKQSLFSHNSPEASRLKVQIMAQRHLVIKGGRWKNDVISWLTRKGF
ncbi:hypothetical protein BDR07DRAFT_1442928 [Suillus spraguei]|nr:hypothetical protein BDR07DRAFT_1442928 [Suillus spraguei]